MPPFVPSADRKVLHAPKSRRFLVLHGRICRTAGCVLSPDRINRPLQHSGLSCRESPSIVSYVRRSLCCRCRNTTHHHSHLAFWTERPILLKVSATFCGRLRAVMRGDPISSGHLKESQWWEWRWLNGEELEILVLLSTLLLLLFFFYSSSSTLLLLLFFFYSSSSTLLATRSSTCYSLFYYSLFFYSLFFYSSTHSSTHSSIHSSIHSSTLLLLLRRFDLILCYPISLHDVLFSKNTHEHI